MNIPAEAYGLMHMETQDRIRELERSMWCHLSELVGTVSTGALGSIIRCDQTITVHSTIRLLLLGRGVTLSFMRLT